MKLHERLAWIFATDFGPSAKAVLVVLAFHANKDECCWPRQSVIAKETGLSRHAVVNTMKLIRKARDNDGLPIIQETRRWHRSTVYTLRFQCSPSELLVVHPVNKNRTVQRTPKASNPKPKKSNASKYYQGPTGALFQVLDGKLRVQPKPSPSSQGQ